MLNLRASMIIKSLHGFLGLRRATVLDSSGSVSPGKLMAGNARRCPSLLSHGDSPAEQVLVDRTRPLGGKVGKRFLCMNQMTRKPPKTRTVYVCQNCGESHSQWWGACPACKEAGTLKGVPESVLPSRGGGGAAVRAVEGVGFIMPRSDEGNSYSRSRATTRSWLGSSGSSELPQRLPDISRGLSASQWRIQLPGDTGLEFSRVLGGGLVRGSLILVGGDPGVGKSTLLLQVASILADGCEGYDPAPVLYISGEESVEQISSRADRINISSHELFLYSATDLEGILSTIQRMRPRAVVIDSIQTVYLPQATGSAGNMNQVRECAAALLRAAKQSQIPIFLIGHLTKAGEIAGPRALEHIVDVVLYMEGESRQSHRLLRVVKNRFGSTDEALCSGLGQQHVGRLVNGVDTQRLFLILAVLTKQWKLKLNLQDVYINVVGGLQIREPAADLAIAVAICSSYYDKQVPTDMVFVGEIGLAGELRSVGQLEKRIVESMKLGFRRCVVPKSALKAVRDLANENIDIIPFSNVMEVVDMVILPTPSVVGRFAVT